MKNFLKYIFQEIKIFFLKRKNKKLKEQMSCMIENDSQIRIWTLKKK
jgi:hypothetical protein